MLLSQKSVSTVNPVQHEYVKSWCEYWMRTYASYPLIIGDRNLLTAKGWFHLQPQRNTSILKYNKLVSDQLLQTRSTEMHTYLLKNSLELERRFGDSI